jgi:CheY-like chemotaxis protein
MATSLLLADDSPTIAKILGMALQSEDYEIRSALTADEALKELYASPPGFFLVDLTLPEKNGYEFARLIRGDKKLQGVKVILLASAFEPADEKAIQECGADGVITKPFDPGDLRRRLREVRDAPPKFPPNTQVQGSLGSTPVNVSPAQEPSGLPPSPPPAAPGENAASEPEADPLAGLLSPAEKEGDASDLLSSILQQTENGSDTPPPPPSPEGTPSFPTLDFNAQEDFSNATVQLEQPTPTDSVLDLSNSFTPPGGTALLDKNKLAEAEPPAAPGSSPSSGPTAPPSSDDLSPNAQALAAFFAAEIDANQGPDSPPVAPSPEPGENGDAFDASLSSIEWGNADLNDWSSAPAKTSPASSPDEPAPMIASSPADSRAPSTPTPSPAAAAPSFQPAPSPIPEPSRHTGASSEGGSFLFDTGGSNFRFADNYIQRITKSHSGDLNEMVLGKEPSPPVFHQQSDDSPAQISSASSSTFSTPTSPATSATPERSAPSAPGGGAWSPEEVKKIEQLVRDEVQMVVREVAEKVIWEVVPELAENLIRKELDKVLKEMEEE